MSPARAKLLKVLAFVQNDAAHQGRDILTFTGFMEDDAEVAEHLIRHARMMEPARQLALVAMARDLNAEAGQ